MIPCSRCGKPMIRIVLALAIACVVAFSVSRGLRNSRKVTVFCGDERHIVEPYRWAWRHVDDCPGCHRFQD